MRLASFLLFSSSSAFAQAPAASPPRAEGPDIKAPTRIEVQGHRGSRARRPENSLPAFQYALETGVDVIELDTGVTRDNVLVLNHEADIEPSRCTHDDGAPVTKVIPIHSLTLKEVKSFKCGGLPHPRFPNQVQVPGTRIPTLDEVFEFVKKSKLPAARKVGFNIETKSFPLRPDTQPAPDEFAALLLKTIKRHGMMKRTVIQSFDHRTLVSVRKLDPNARISALVDSPEINLVATALALKADILSPRWDLLRAWDVNELRKAGVKIVAWTANQPDEWDLLLDMKVDAIISDDPAPMIEYLQKKGRR